MKRPRSSNTAALANNKDIISVPLLQPVPSTEPLMGCNSCFCFALVPTANMKAALAPASFIRSNDALPPARVRFPLKNYNKLVEEASDFLHGKSQAIQENLRVKMRQASQAQAYEEAAGYRDRIAALTQIQAHQSILPTGFSEADLFAFHAEGGVACIQVFFVRTGQNWGNRAYYPRIDKSHTASEILESFIAQFYDNKPIPKLVLTSHAIENTALLTEGALNKR